jgi:hypothetical protein
VASGALAPSAELGSPSAELEELLEDEPEPGLAPGLDAAPDSPGNGNFLSAGTPGFSGAGEGSGACGAPVSAGAVLPGCGDVLLSPGNGNLSVVVFLSSAFEPHEAGCGTTLQGEGEAGLVVWAVLCAKTNAGLAAIKSAAASSGPLCTRHIIVTSLDALHGVASRSIIQMSPCNILS